MAAAADAAPGRRFVIAVGAVSAGCSLTVSAAPLGVQSALLGQGAEGDRPARRGHRGDAVLPFVARFAGQMIDRAGC